MEALPGKLMEQLAVRDGEDTEKILRLWQRSQNMRVRKFKEAEVNNDLMTTALKDRRARL